MPTIHPQPRVLTYDQGRDHITWPGAVEALRRGHLLPRAQVGDIFLGPASGALLSRAAYIEGLGYGVKSVTVFGANPARDLPTVQGAMLVFGPDDGSVRAIIDSRLVTEFKTAGDSVLGAQLLARPDSRHLLILGAGAVAASLVQAYSAAFPRLERISVWARRSEQAEALVASLGPVAAPVAAVTDLQAAVQAADIISSATMAREPLILGDWVRPGTHVDLIGAYKADMREADDHLMAKAALYVDSRDTTLGHIGELMMPIASGAISEASVRGDLYDLVALATSARRSADEVTVFKNGGGAHLDLMIASHIAGSD
ncbi:ornithine cyclodeaminase family protein [Paracoccus sp. T5]|uniref:ornithine cyclodeaminase family protein n=1 Tax=Paracoccus sp. T5 TaxID=3402161 RepID=UPI003ADB39AE